MVSLLGFLFGKKESSAKVAKGRLLFTIAHERANRNQPDDFVRLQADLIELISKYIKTDPHEVHIQRERQNNAEILNIVLPEANEPVSVARAPEEDRRSWTDLWFGKKRKSASIAKERLMIMIARDENHQDTDYFVPLERELISLIADYLSVDPATINMHRERQDRCEVLNIVLPEGRL